MQQPFSSVYVYKLAPWSLFSYHFGENEIKVFVKLGTKPVPMGHHYESFFPPLNSSAVILENELRELL